MDKVYIIMWDCEFGAEMYGIYSTREKAESAYEKFWRDEGYDDDYLEVEPDIFTLEEYREYMWLEIHELDKGLK